LKASIFTIFSETIVPEASQIPTLCVHLLAKKSNTSRTVPGKDSFEHRIFILFSIFAHYFSSLKQSAQFGKQDVRKILTLC